MPAIPMNNSRNVPDDGQTPPISPSPSMNSGSTFSEQRTGDYSSSFRGSVSDGSLSMSGRYSDAGSARRSHRGDSSDDDSDFYSEDDSDNSEGYADGAGHQQLASAASAQRTSHGRHTAHRGDFTRSIDSHGPAASPNTRGTSAGRRNSTASGVYRASATDTPLSYFHRHNVKSFSIANEFRCYAGHLRHLYRTIEEDRLPWGTDFADRHKMRFPRKMKEVAGRLNLNIPYYSSNYIELFYVVTMPFLLVYNTPFFLVALLTMVMIHSVTMRRKNTKVYGESVTILGRPVSYRKLAHVLLFSLVMLFMFFNGLRTLAWVALLNLCVIVPHALLRMPTYFDDEELEKCRPKLAQYAIVLLLLALDYLEGDVKENDQTESRRLVELERKRLAAVIEKREGRG